MDALPERIGAYRVEGMLGKGGMGVVYRARRDDGTPVALKTLHATYTDETLARFEREAMVRVEHRNVVRVLESGVAGQASFIALELLDGESFSERLKRGTVSAAELAGILAQACD